MNTYETNPTQKEVKRGKIMIRIYSIYSKDKEWFNSGFFGKLSLLVELKRANERAEIARPGQFRFGYSDNPETSESTISEIYDLSRRGVRMASNTFFVLTKESQEKRMGNFDFTQPTNEASTPEASKDKASKDKASKDKASKVRRKENSTPKGDREQGRSVFCDVYIATRLLDYSKTLLRYCKEQIDSHKMEQANKEVEEAEKASRKAKEGCSFRALSCEISNILLSITPKKDNERDNERDKERAKERAKEMEKSANEELNTLKGLCPFNDEKAEAIINALEKAREACNPNGEFTYCITMEITEKPLPKAEKLPDKATKAGIKVGTKALKEIIHFETQDAAAFIGVLAYAGSEIFEACKSTQPLSTKNPGFNIEVTAAQLNGISAAVFGEKALHKDRILTVLSNLRNYVGYDAQDDDGSEKRVYRPFIVTTIITDKKTGCLSRIRLNVSPGIVEKMKGGYARVANGAFSLRREKGGDEAFLLYLAVLSEWDRITAARRAGERFSFSVNLSKFFDPDGKDPTHVGRKVERALKHVSDVAELIGTEQIEVRTRATGISTQQKAVEFVFVPKNTKTDPPKNER